MTVEWTLDRLEKLRADYASGNSQLMELSRRQAALHDSVLRIEGAISVLEEQIAADPAFAATARPAG